MERIVREVTHHVIHLFDNLEELLVVIVARIGPWMAPVAPTWLVANTVMDHFRAPEAVGLAVGITLEAVGVAATHITLEMRSWNANRNKTDPKAPFEIGVVVSAAYFAVGLGLTVALELWPDLVVLAPAAFFLMAIIAYITLGLISDHSRRKAAKAASKTKTARNTGIPVPTGIPTGSTNGKGPALSEQTLGDARAIRKGSPGISGSELGRQLGKSERWGRLVLAQLKQEDDNVGT